MARVGRSRGQSRGGAGLRRRRVLPVATGCLLLFASTAPLAFAAPGTALRTTPKTGGAAGSARTPTPGSYQDGVVLVGFDRGVTAAQRLALEARAGGHDLRTIGVGTHLLQVADGRVPAALAALRGQPGVRYADPNSWMHATSISNDPSLSVQWALQNNGQVVRGQQTLGGQVGADIHAGAAWRVTTGSRTSVIAEVDSGVDYTHPDLAANIWQNPGGVNGCPAGTHGYDVMAGSCDPIDTWGHGTHVAGIMGAVGNNGIGVAGVNWTASIMAVKWMDQHGGTEANLISALGWVLSAKQAGVNVRVVNDSGVDTSGSQAMLDAINALGANNILFVASAGNASYDLDTHPIYPCSFQAANELCVGASTPANSMASFSNWGPNTVDLIAPGVNIYSTLPNDTYGYVTGTSLSAPMVSGAAALILAANPSLTVTQLKSDILTSVDPLPALQGVVRSGGTLDVCRAIPACASTMVTPPMSNLVAVTGGDLALWVRPSPGDAFVRLGGRLLDPPAVALAPDGTRYYIGRGADNNIWIRTDQVGWWRAGPPGTNCREPSATVFGSSLLVVCRGSDNALWMGSAVLGAGLPVIHSFASLGGRLTGGPAVTLLDGIPTYLVPGGTYNRANGANLFYRTPWQGYRPLYTGWGCLGAPAFAAASGFYYVACEDARTHRMDYLRRNEVTASVVSSSAGMVLGVPGLAVCTNGVQAVAYVEGTDRAPWTTTITASGSTGFTRLNGFIGPAGVASVQTSG